MALITHMNLTNEDGNVYCCLRNKIVLLNDLQVLNYCSSCTMNKGLQRGKSVNCIWDDLRDVKNPHIVFDPNLEYKSMQQRKSDTRAIKIHA